MEYNLSLSVSLLERTPGTLTAFLSGLPGAWIDATEGEGTWSPRTIVAHLLHAERTNWIPRARVIREHGRARPLPAFDQSGQLRELADTPMHELLELLGRTRAESLATLASWHIDQRSLALEGEHPQFGAVTLAQLFSAWVAHDLAHLAQIARVLAKQHRDAVGPWRVYLPIMDR